jgi:hypothetical protein
MNTTLWQKGRTARRLWSRNAIRAKARLRIERAESVLTGGFTGDAVNVRPAKPTWRINIERHDGQRIQISAIAIHGKLLHGDTLETGKQLGRRIGVLLQEGAL